MVRAIVAKVESSTCYSLTCRIHLLHLGIKVLRGRGVGGGACVLSRASIDIRFRYSHIHRVDRILKVCVGIGRSSLQRTVRVEHVTHLISGVGTQLEYPVVAHRVGAGGSHRGGLCTPGVLDGQNFQNSVVSRISLSVRCHDRLCTVAGDDDEPDAVQSSPGGHGFARLLGNGELNLFGGLFGVHRQIGGVGDVDRSNRRSRHQVHTLDLAFPRILESDLVGGGVQLVACRGRLLLDGDRGSGGDAG